MKVTDGQLDEMAQAVRRAGNVTADRPWDEVPLADKAYYRHLVRAVLELVPDEAAKEPQEVGGAPRRGSTVLGELKWAAEHLVRAANAHEKGDVCHTAQGLRRSAGALRAALKLWSRMAMTAAKEPQRWRVEDGVRHLTDRLHLVIEVENADPDAPPFQGYWFLKSDGFTLEIVERLRDELNARLDAEEGDG